MDVRALEASMSDGPNLRLLGTDGMGWETRGERAALRPDETRDEEAFSSHRRASRRMQLLARHHAG